MASAIIQPLSFPTSVLLFVMPFFLILSPFPATLCRNSLSRHLMSLLRTPAVFDSSAGFDPSTLNWFVDHYYPHLTGILDCSCPFLDISAQLVWLDSVCFSLSSSSPPRLESKCPPASSFSSSLYPLTYIVALTFLAGLAFRWRRDPWGLHMGPLLLLPLDSLRRCRSCCSSLLGVLLPRPCHQISVSCFQPPPIPPSFPSRS
jgi:hypothetical protein